jgi:4-carboxymuconolactone decarboxylase
MARIEQVKRENLDQRQQQLYDTIMRSRPRATLSGPFSVLIHTPDLAQPINEIADCLRHNSRLDKRLIELIILLACRGGDAKYAWSAHVPLARAAGLPEATIDAIRARKRPDELRDDETVIYDLVAELLATKTLSAAMFERATAAFGRDGVIEAVSCAGFYGMVGLIVNAFDIPPQPGGEVLP